MNRTIRRCLLAAATTLSIAAVPSSALATTWYFAPSPGVSLYSGGDYHAPVPSGYRGDIISIGGRGQPTAYSSVYVVDSSGNRISAQGDCDATHGGPSCTAGYYWGPAPAGPSGYGNVHNHGNGSPNNFTAFVTY